MIMIIIDNGPILVPEGSLEGLERRDTIGFVLTFFDATKINIFIGMLVIIIDKGIF
jgi:hypothetical protein